MATMIRSLDPRAKTAPSHYPRVLFHSVRFLQLIASLVVGAIMCYFLWHLTHDHYAPPWTFIWLTASSLFSLVALTTTIVLHCCFGLNPALNALVNVVLLVLWSLSWSLLAWWTSRTMSHFCDYDNWSEDLGVMVCRIYKALFAFTLVGFVSTLAAFVLDIYVRRQQTRRGIYRLQEHELKVRPEATRGPFTDEEQHYDQGGLAEPRESEAWDAHPRPSIGPYAEPAEVEKSKDGYAVPESQFEYDTGYHGAAHSSGETRGYYGS